MKALFIALAVREACANLRMELGREITPEEEREILLAILREQADNECAE